MDTEKRTNVYEMVTKQILTTLMKGEIPWRQTYFKKGKKPPYSNKFTGKPYSFLNGMLLGKPGEYATFNQIKDHGGFVKKGAKSSIVIYWGEYIPKENKEEAEQLEKEGKSFEHLKVKFPKYYRVFNIDDAEGIKVEEEPVEMQSAEDPTDIADMVVDDYTVNEQVLVKEDDSVDPFYDPLTDTVTIPSKSAFGFEEDFYASLFGQFIHSTASETRCARKKELESLKEKEATVKEELIAEIGSSMCMQAVGLERKETREQQAAVCQKWIDIFKRDYRLIVSASYGAEKAAKLVLGDFAA